MKYSFIPVLIICLLVFTLDTAHAQDTRPRTALVIACDYGDSQLHLEGPPKDADAMEAKLQGELGFKVTVRKNPNRKEFLGLINTFTDELSQNKGIGLFYFSGHGVQYKGKNYLVPANPDLEHREDLPVGAVPLEHITDQMQNAGNGLNLLFVDACRDNKLPSKYEIKGIPAKGLAPVDPVDGFVIGFATQPGVVASGTPDKGGYYTQALLSRIATPGLSVVDMLSLVRNDVSKMTHKQQVPSMVPELDGVLYLVPIRPINGGSDTPSPQTDQSKKLAGLLQQTDIAERKGEWEKAAGYLQQAKSLAPNDDSLLPRLKRANILKDFEVPDGSTTIFFTACQDKEACRRILMIWMKLFPKQFPEGRDRFYGMDRWKDGFSMVYSRVYYSPSENSAVAKRIADWLPGLNSTVDYDAQVDHPHVFRERGSRGFRLVNMDSDRSLLIFIGSNYDAIEKSLKAVWSMKELTSDEQQAVEDSIANQQSEWNSLKKQ